MGSSRKIEHMADLELTIRYQDIEDGWVMASVLELPGVNTQGATYEEARENILDALRDVLVAKSELNGDDGEAGVRIENLAFHLVA